MACLVAALELLVAACTWDLVPGPGIEPSIKTPSSQLHQNYCMEASLVAQWLRICLPMQGTRVQALVWEDPTCRGAAKNHEPQLLSLRVWSLCSATREAATGKGLRTTMKTGPHLPQLEKALAQKRRPNTAKNK